MTAARWLILLALFIGSGHSGSGQPVDIKSDPFKAFGPVMLQKIRNVCQTSPDEPWRTIPWKISLIEAQNLAAESRKPIFIWAMDGHPLGCT